MGLFLGSSTFSGTLRNGSSTAFLEIDKPLIQTTMKSRIIFLLAIVLLASCSTPKYAYYFDHHNYNSVKRQPIIPNEASPLSISSSDLTASVSAEPVMFTAKTESASSLVAKTYVQMNKAERKILRNHLNKELKSFLFTKKIDGTHEAAAAEWDNDAKLATIFGAVGITGLIIGGNVFNVIGAIALVIGVVFFVKWIIRQ